MEFKDIVKNLRIEFNFTQEDLSKRLEISKSTVAMWETGKRLPSPELYGALADVFNVDMDYLMGRTNIKRKVSYNFFGKEYSSSTSAVSINVLGRVAAGIPINAIEEIIDTEEISEELAKTGEFFGLQIHGNSMEPRICEGDVVIVRQQSDAESGDIVIALVNGDDATCKRLRKYRDGIELISNNPNYEPMFFSDKDIETKPVRIIGKVVELRGKF